MIRKLSFLAVVISVIVSVLSLPAYAQKVTGAEDQQPDRIRGEITKVDSSSIVVKSKNGKTVTLSLEDYSSIFSLSKASFTDVDFGVYVGSVSKKLDKYSPIVRDSLSWLHQGYELRVIDESLRGLAVGHTPWDLTNESVITHGWVDDLEIRVLSIKYGPTEEEETDVDISRDVPILKLATGDRSLIKVGRKIFAGAQMAEGKYVAVFIMVGQDGIAPPL
jgi:hypothetical protein